LFNDSPLPFVKIDSRLTISQTQSIETRDESVNVRFKCKPPSLEAAFRSPFDAIFFVRQSLK
jgi:hypothetical protein